MKRVSVYFADACERVPTFLGAVGARHCSELQFRFYELLFTTEMAKKKAKKGKKARRR